MDYWVRIRVRIIEVCLVIGGALLSPLIKNQGNLIYYFKGLTSHECLACVLGTGSVSKGHIPGEAPVDISLYGQTSLVSTQM